MTQLRVPQNQSCVVLAGLSGSGQGLSGCGRHGATFEIDTGLRVDGLCEGAGLEQVALAVIDGDICLCGVSPVEDDTYPAEDELDDTMEIMIHPD